MHSGSQKRCCAEDTHPQILLTVDGGDELTSVSLCFVLNVSMNYFPVWLCMGKVKS